jgi:hypothetical protein
MDKRLTLPAYGALLLAAAAFGVHFGQSAIEQINPIYFQGAAVHPRDRGAAVDGALQAQPVRFSDHYGWEEGQAARSADCVDCQALRARDQYANSEVHLAVAQTEWRTEPRAPRVEAVAVAEPQAQPAAEEQPTAFIVEWAEVDRYAGFAVEEEPKPADEPPAEE